MDIAVLATELTTDPLTIGYGPMTDVEAANSLNTANREVNVASVTGQQIFEATDPTDYNNLTEAQLQQYWGICGMGEVLVNAGNTKTALLAMFGGGTTTRANLAILQKTTVSRATELGLGNVRAGNVQEARNQ